MFQNQKTLALNFNLNIANIKKSEKELESDTTTTSTEKKNQSEKKNFILCKINKENKKEEKEKEGEKNEKVKDRIEIKNTNKENIYLQNKYNNKNILNYNLNIENNQNNKRKELNNENFFKSKIDNNYDRRINQNFRQNQYNFNCINNNLFYLQNRFNYMNQALANIIGQKNEFEKIRYLGICALNNPLNLNHYLLTTYNNYGNNNLNFNNINQFSPFKNSLNFNFNYYGIQNPLITNYLQNHELLNMNTLNKLNNISNISNSNKPKKYIITFKSKTNIPNVEKVQKIEVCTSYHKKENPKIKQENPNPQAKKEKLIKNIINLEDINSGKEKRTVVRLNPIPPNYSSFDISKLLDKYLKIETSKNNRIYKAVYTPLCKIIGKNLGYCFIMMVHPKYVIDFYNVFSGKILAKKKCNKPCNVIWADIQGDDFLKLNEDDPIRKPLIFKDIIKD